MQVQVFNSKGQSTGRTVTLPAEIFGIEPHEHVVYLAVKAYLANQRQGTHKAKTRKEIHGSTRKLHKQKGTGGSRKGDIKNPLYHGGGRVHGPVPRDYTQKLPAKVKALARKSVLSAKAQENSIIVVEDFTFDAPKTAQYRGMLESFKVSGKKSLVMIADHDKNVSLSGRNIPNSEVIKATDFNVYQVLNATTVLISESAVNKIAESFS